MENKIIIIGMEAENFAQFALPEYITKIGVSVDEVKEDCSKLSEIQKVSRKDIERISSQMSLIHKNTYIAENKTSSVNPHDRKYKKFKNK
jgi:hypothetical protein